MQAFVTVGSTSFDQLIEVINTQEFHQVLKDLNVTSLKIQMGRGTVIPRTENTSLKVEYYKFKPSISEDLSSSDLVISHAGSGSILESLALKKNLIVVVNELLMDNHQTELAHQLHKENYLISTTPKTLISALQTFRFGSFKPFPPTNPKIFQSILNEEMGY